MRGFFTIDEQVVPNSVVAEGEKAFLDMICRNAVDVVAADGNFYVGLCGEVVVSNSTVLADLTEPTTGSYTRLAIPRSLAGWPSLTPTAAGYRADTTSVVFSPDAVDYDITVSRAFLASSIDNTGKLLAISNPLPVSKQLLAGDIYTIAYGLYIR